MHLMTHPTPHLDDVAGIWLLKRFDARYRAARIGFEPARSSAHPERRGVVYVGVGRGRFDEHKGDVHESATTLVWKYIKGHARIARDTKYALERIVRWVRDEDHARNITLPLHEFSLPVVISHMPALRGVGSSGAVEIGFTMLDALLAAHIEEEKFRHAWKRRITFKTPWGRGVGVTSSASSISIARTAFRAGFVLYASVDQKRRYRAIKATGAVRVNLTEAYARAKQLEPRADWYLHHSKRMLICGSDVAQNKILSRLTLKKLIGLVRI